MSRDEAGRWGRPLLGLTLSVLAIFLFVHRHFPAPSIRLRPHRSFYSPHALPLKGITLVLDPGHGGADSGAVRHGDCEAALTYRTAVEVAEDVRRAGGHVVFTVRSRALDPRLDYTEPPLWLPRDAVLSATGAPLRLRRDETPRPLWLRAAVARTLWDSDSTSIQDRANSLFFLSLHYDDASSSHIHGSLVCVDRRMPAIPKFAQILAASLSAAGLSRHDTWHGLHGIDAEHLGVLDPRENPVPQRLLLEVATISNAQDACHAADPVWRHAMAARITEALIATCSASRNQRR
jgi:N-acetylmuramoyl-L-alanine amidase